MYFSYVYVNTLKEKKINFKKKNGVGQYFFGITRKHFVREVCMEKKNYLVFLCLNNFLI